MLRVKNLFTYLVEVKVTPLTRHRGGVEVYLYLCLTSALDVGGRSKPRSGCFTPGESALLPTVEEAERAAGQV
jgi:hypothetical protein